MTAAFFQYCEPYHTALSSVHLAMGYVFRSRYCPAGLISDRNFDPCFEPSLLLGDAAGGLGTRDTQRLISQRLHTAGSIALGLELNELCDLH